MIVGVVDQGDTVDNAIPARNVNQGFLVTFTPPLQAAIVFRRVVDRPLTGQREALFGRQEVLAAEPDGRPLLDVDGFVFGEREIFSAPVRSAASLTSTGTLACPPAGTTS